MIYTLLANCAVHDLDPEIYLAEVIRRLSPASTPEQIADLTPAKPSVIHATDRAEAAASPRCSFYDVYA
ncbi:MAG: transposase domain-containing protein [Verrucomicrobiales bacterium]